MKNSSNCVLRSILISFLALLLISPAHITSWQYNNARISPVTNPFSQTETQVVVNPTQANMGGRQFCLHNEQSGVTISLCENGIMLWRSPQAWQVQEAFFADLNRDGITEAVLLVRRPFAPWPIDRFLPAGGRIKDFHDKEGFSCHVILLALWNGRFKEAWAGSAMVQPIRNLVAADLDGDGYEELAALEYRYDRTPRRASLVIWQWNGFGFSLAGRQTGNYSSMKVLKNQQGTWLVTN